MKRIFQNTQLFISRMDRRHLQLLMLLLTLSLFVLGAGAPTASSGPGGM
jgi:hypothetical protein